jgi:hypothetical protein
MSVLSVTTDELKQAGIPYRIEQGSKHFKVKVNGLPQIVCSRSPSDRRSEIAARSLVRRLIRQNGLGVIA